MTTWTFRVLETWNGYDSSTIRQHLHPPFVVSCGIFFKCLANRLPVWRVDINCDGSFDSSQIESIRQHFHGLKVINCGIFLSVLQIDFWYTSRSIRVKLNRFDNIFNNPWQLLANWLPVCVSISWEMVYQICGITRRIRKLLSTNRSGLGVLGNPHVIFSLPRICRDWRADFISQSMLLVGVGL